MKEIVTAPAPNAMDAAIDDMLKNPDSLKDPVEGSGGEAPEGGAPGSEQTKEGEEGSEGDGGKIAKAAPAEEPDDEKFAEANIGKPIPYARFKKVLDGSKALREKLKAAEGGGDFAVKFAGLEKEHKDLKATHETSQGNFRKLADMLGGYPPLEAAVEALVRGEGKIGPEVLAETVAALQELAKGGGADPAKAAPAGDSRLVREIAELRARLDGKEKSEQENASRAEVSKAYDTEIKDLKSPKSEVRKKIEKNHPGLEVDDSFMAEVMELGSQAARVAEIENGPRPSLYTIAEAVAARHFALKQRYLGKRVSVLNGKQGAALERTGGPAGKKIPKQPPFGSPEWTKWALENKDYLASDPGND